MKCWFSSRCSPSKYSSRWDQGRRTTSVQTFDVFEGVNGHRNHDFRRVFSCFDVLKSRWHLIFLLFCESPDFVQHAVFKSVSSTPERTVSNKKCISFSRGPIFFMCNMLVFRDWQNETSSANGSPTHDTHHAVWRWGLEDVSVECQVGSRSLRSFKTWERCKSWESC